MESTDEVTRKTLELLQSSDFTKELEQFNAKCIKPTMNVMAKKIVKAKKKLKKLQKRQRKQDKQGVTQKFNIEPPIMLKITDEMMDAIRERYGITRDDKGNEFIKPL